MSKLEAYLQREAAVEPDDNRLLRDVAYERLKDAIRHADLEPGEPLSETRLSKLLGISRTPVREALQSLAQEGLVQVIPGRAITVASRSLHDVLNVVHMRSILEPALVKLVAESAGPRHKEALLAALVDMEAAVAAGDQLAWSLADTRYHETISDACPNELLGELAVQMRNRVHHLANVDSQTNPDRLAECTAEHRVLAEAIAAGDGAAAEEAMRDHIEALRQSLFSRLTYG